MARFWIRKQINECHALSILDGMSTADLMQPGLVPLQPNLDDLMDYDPMEGKNSSSTGSYTYHEFISLIKISNEKLDFPCILCENSCFGNKIMTKQ